MNESFETRKISFRHHLQDCFQEISSNSYYMWVSYLRLIKKNTPNTSQFLVTFLFFFQKADFALCDLTITYERRTAVDFTMPFMTLGKKIYF
jgi:hypothetical protein